ncbi:hypothetical protein [Pollutibacter soli]|uniref:hypothetical protein n=1 Tax=Pollutibacter soli TaxID=3034157 RepID=UPI0030133A20
MKKSLSLCFLIFSAQQVFTQTVILEIKGNKLSDFIKIEENLGSERIKNKNFHAVESGIAQPIEYRRKETGIPDLLVYYFYREKDSSISYIQYEWLDRNFRGENEIVKKTRSEAELLNGRYDQLYKKLTAIYGKSDSEEQKSAIERIDTEIFKRKSIWKKEGNYGVELYTVISNIYKKEGMITIRPTFTLRMYIYDFTD